MERMGHCIRQAVEEGLWKSMQFSVDGLGLSHLFFADDLVLFCKAELEHARIVKEILTQFCYFSGHKVNNQKSQIYFLAIVDNTVANEIREYLGVIRTDDLGKYLGVPLLHL
ncbi:hypothetical protein PVK06_035300 [Gossypium arboreum]|uniref:Reverse transcriptase domain-containing protein n=1 Tax=Gossypium arboreum TaxID=29729 RepID=A0ABR0NGG3_GOSAR|nr:hypothetical protein PVK06_035300 [Gossypium arboreum]